ncbi:hypothetical protein HHK36_027438 [Tetracentron sinense]|uniref:RRM domain-containing protein n=1 Tax=Tetracentron sinense TaxID=13715 RepID=A0A835D128_TETSI|nr:hypothetical protein HHK36_027438 [Tetracentron sinense]
MKNFAVMDSRFSEGVFGEITKMRPVFCGNFEYETRHSDLERLFSRYGRVERVDIKSGKRNPDLAVVLSINCPVEIIPNSCVTIAPSDISYVVTGFAFVYFDDERDAEDAIRGLDNISFGYSKRRLSVEWARGDRGAGTRYHDGSKSMANQKPTKTLFVINFDPIQTRIRDIERHFEPYGKVLHVRIRRNFAFVQFETQEDATKALECTHMSKILDRVVSVEYALRDDGEQDDRRDSPRRGSYSRRGDSPYGRSRSPVHLRGRPSPDYGRARSPVYDRYNGPAYDRNRSPDYAARRSGDQEHEEKLRAAWLGRGVLERTELDYCRWPHKSHVTESDHATPIYALFDITLWEILPAPVQPSFTLALNSS